MLQCEDYLTSDTRLLNDSETLYSEWTKASGTISHILIRLFRLIRPPFAMVCCGPL